MPVDARLQPLFERIEADRACRYRADATAGDLARLEATLKFPLPPSYLAFLRRFNGVIGYPFQFYGARPRWIAGEPLESAADLSVPLRRRGNCGRQPDADHVNTNPTTAVVRLMPTSDQ